jgi:hypothetical protein
MSLGARLGTVRSLSMIGLPAPAESSSNPLSGLRRRTHLRRAFTHLTLRSPLRIALLPRDLSARATLVASLLSAGCAVPAEDADVDAADLPAIDQPIENGELRPSSLNGGTALVKVRGPTGLLTSCSGQVVARDTILTAAHCLYDVGVYSGGWSKTKSVKVTITHQDPDGSWTSLSAANESVSAYVREEYVTLRNSNDKRAFGWDMAVLRRAIPYGNLVPQ